MKKIIKYHIFSSYEQANELITLVNEHIEKGWQPYGEMIVLGDRSNSSRTYVQVMVKYESETSFA
jgi:hypothetical protein